VACKEGETYLPILFTCLIKKPVLVTKVLLDGSGSNSVVARHYLISKTSKQALGSARPPFHWEPGFCPRCKRLGREVRQ
jgi:hypothetical protein